MPRYSDELIEEVRSGNDIVDVISGYVHLKKKGSSYFGLCPFHNEKSPSFSVSPNKQMYYCFGCGAGGNVFTFLMEYENYTFPEALEMLADRAGMTLPKQELSAEQKKEADKRTKILELNKIAAKYFYAQLRSERGTIGMRYFEKRQLSQETMQKFGLGYSNKFSDDLYQYLRKLGYSDEILKDSGLVTVDERRGGYDKFWNRVMFPIMDRNSKVIGFGGRVLGDGEPKYLNSPETVCFDKSRNLYGLNFAKNSKREGILLCEGYMDVIALHQAGFDNAVAALGTAFTPGHANLLKRFTKEVFLTFDSDGAGIKAALRAIPILKEAGISAKVVHMNPHKDPDEFIKALGADAYEKRIQEAENSFLFEISVMEANYDLKDPEGKTTFYNEIARKLLGFSQELERNNYIEAVADKYQMGYESLHQLVNHFGTNMTAADREKLRTPLKSGVQEKKKENGMQLSQKLLLTWLVEHPNLYNQIKSFISPDDFTESSYKEVAEVLFSQFEENQVNPAKIISMFQNEEEQREVASIFNATIKDVDSKDAQEKAVVETIKRIKLHSNEVKSKNLAPDDMSGLQQILNERQKMREIDKLHISID